jgi:hypothetical protein
MKRVGILCLRQSLSDGVYKAATRRKLLLPFSPICPHQECRPRKTMTSGLDTPSSSSTISQTYRCQPTNRKNPVTATLRNSSSSSMSYTTVLNILLLRNGPAFQNVWRCAYQVAPDLVPAR